MHAPHPTDIYTNTHCHKRIKTKKDDINTSRPTYRQFLPYNYDFNVIFEHYLQEDTDFGL